MNSYETGELHFLDFETLNNTFKVNWLQWLVRLLEIHLELYTFPYAFLTT